MTGTIQQRFEAKFTKSDGCWGWNAYKDSNGYGKIRIDGRSQYAHRIAYHLYVSEIPEGLCVCHRCDNPCCVNPAHLFLGTIADNVRDCENKGRGADTSGENNGNAKLNAAQSTEIRAMYGKGANQYELAKEFGVSQSTISSIVCGQTWAKI